MTWRHLRKFAQAYRIAKIMVQSLSIKAILHVHSQPKVKFSEYFEKNKYFLIKVRKKSTVLNMLRLILHNHKIEKSLINCKKNSDK